MKVEDKSIFTIPNKEEIVGAFRILKLELELGW